MDILLPRRAQTGSLPADYADVKYKRADNPVRPKRLLFALESLARAAQNHATHPEAKTAQRKNTLSRATVPRRHRNRGSHPGNAFPHSQQTLPLRNLFPRTAALLAEMPNAYRERTHNYMSKQIPPLPFRFICVFRGSHSLFIICDIRGEACNFPPPLCIRWADVHEWSELMH